MKKPGLTPTEKKFVAELVSVAQKQTRKRYVGLAYSIVRRTIDDFLFEKAVEKANKRP